MRQYLRELGFPFLSGEVVGLALRRCADKEAVVLAGRPYLRSGMTNEVQSHTVLTLIRKKG